MHVRCLIDFSHNFLLKDRKLAGKREREREREREIQGEEVQKWSNGHYFFCEVPSSEVTFFNHFQMGIKLFTNGPLVISDI